ncbi:MAG: gamma-glutamyltransferase family protein [Gaiellaceae bacterium]
MRTGLCYIVLVDLVASTKFMVEHGNDRAAKRIQFFVQSAINSILQIELVNVGVFVKEIGDAVFMLSRHSRMCSDGKRPWSTSPERAPAHVTYRGLDVFGMGPPSSGGSTVGEALNIVEGYPLATMTREAALHHFLEASRYSFADRGAYLADPAYFDVPLTGLLSDGFAATRRALITPTAAMSPVAPGNPYPFNGGVASVQASASETRVGTTTHVTTADRWGNVVSYTFTIESTGGAGLVVPGYGFLANNELTDFNFDSLTHPNRVEGGKRPRSSMSPTIVLRDGDPLLAVGSPGGSTIITTVLQILIDRLDLGLTLPQAIADPRLSQRNTAATQVEPAFLATPEAAALQARGHVLTATPEIGAATGIEFLDEDRLLAAAEPVRRGGGSAMVVSPSP